MLPIVVDVIKNVVVISLTLVEIAMLLRAVLSWFPLDGNRFIEFLIGITEPFIYPIRALFVKLNLFQNLPIDISFTISFLLISTVITLLSQFL